MTKNPLIPAEYLLPNLIAAANYLKAGGVACLNTDTVLGLHALAEPRGITALNLIKGVKSIRVGYIMGVDSEAMAHTIAKINTREPIKPGITYIATSHSGTSNVAFRIITNSVLGRLIRYMNQPLYTTSCNLSGYTPALDASQAWNYFQGRVKYWEGLKKATKTRPSPIINLLTKEVIRR